MKKIKIELKYFMIGLVIVFALLLTFSGGLNDNKTSTAYKTTINGSDGARVAKWDIASISRREGETLELSTGFAGEITSKGNWYFEIENKSEVNAMLNKNSTVTFRLLHDSFKNFEEKEISWNFLDGKDNEIKFILYACEGNINDLLKYVNNSDSTDIIDYTTYMSLSPQEKDQYTEKYLGEDETEICKLDSSMTQTFKKTSGTIDEVSQIYYELTFDFSELTDDQSILGFGDSKKNTTFRLFWDVPYQCTEHVDANSDGYCDKCEDPISTQTFAYNKYIISETSTDIDGYKIYRGEGNIDDTTKDPIVFKDEDGNDCYIFVSDAVDFFGYQKYTSTLGGEPMYEFLNSTNTQELLVNHSKLSDEQIEQIETYSLEAGSNVDKAWERLTYYVYEQFSADYDEVQSSLSYMSYGITLQIIYNLKVEQVD